jgi:hypothetical protein
MHLFRDFNVPSYRPNIASFVYLRVLRIPGVVRTLVYFCVLSIMVLLFSLCIRAYELSVTWTHENPSVCLVYSGVAWMCGPAFIAWL